MQRLRAAILACPESRAEALEPGEKARCLFHLHQLLLCHGETPYPIVSANLVASDGAHSLCSVATLTPSEELLNYCYNHPENKDIPPCLRGRECLGTAVCTIGTGVPYGLPLPEFRTTRTRHLRNMPRHLCIMCTTEMQAGAGMDQNTQAQVYCLELTRRAIPENKLVAGPGGVYRALDLQSCMVVNRVIGDCLVFMVDPNRNDTF
jgi:hypothetical protein